MKKLSMLSLGLVVSLGVAGSMRAAEVLKLAVMLDSLNESVPELPAKVTESFNKLKAMTKTNGELEAKLKVTTGEERFMALTERLQGQAAFNEEFINFFKELYNGVLKHVFFGLSKIPKLKDSLILNEVKDSTGKPMPMGSAIAGLINAAASSNTKYQTVVDSMESYAQPKGSSSAGAAPEAAPMDF